MPKEIQEAFAEAQTCMRAKAFTATAIMCRKTLESICHFHHVKASGSLAAQLKKLKEDGVIEARLFEWAEALRTIGNDAAHEIGFIVRREDATTAIFAKPDFADAYKNRGMAHFDGEIKNRNMRVLLARRMQVHGSKSKIAENTPAGFEKAIANLSEALRLNPNDAEAHY